jgi:hypothetical protein
MTYDHRASHLHRAELDREIDRIRLERSLDPNPSTDGLFGRARRNAGRALIAAGEALGGETKLRAHRA